MFADLTARGCAPPPPHRLPHPDSGVWVWLQDTVEAGVKGARLTFLVRHASRGRIQYVGPAHQPPINTLIPFTHFFSGRG